METARSLRYATRGILLPSLVLAVLGTAAAASPGQVSSGHVRPSVVSARSCKVRTGPWMFGSRAESRMLVAPAIHTGPWMFVPKIHTGPWMFSVTIGSGTWTQASPDSLRAIDPCRVAGAPA